MDLKQTIGSIVAEDYRTAMAFSKWGIDFCCKSGSSLADVCTQKGIHTDVVIEALWEARHQPEEPLDRHVRYWSATELAEYIERQHHGYVRETAQALGAYLKKIVSVHGRRHPELQEIFALFTEAAVELLGHMVKEETVLFPAIKRMEGIAPQCGILDTPFFFGKVEDPISMMRLDHEAERGRFARIAALSNNSTPPEDACNTYRVAFAKLKEFEADLHRHIHLENNILFHKAVALQAQLKSSEAEPSY
jgi:regulator of cell morphogenesis and NO signaling